MDRSNVITLLHATKSQDQFGIWRETLTEREVFCQVDSVSAPEYFEGGRNGLNPAFRMTMFYGDYDGEEAVIYNGNTYSIYRTYQRRDDTIELYVERKGGTNGKKGHHQQSGGGN